MDINKVIKAAVIDKEEQLMEENLVYNRSWEAIEDIMDNKSSKLKKMLSNIFKKKLAFHFREAAAILAFIILLIAVPVASRWNSTPSKESNPASADNNKFSEVEEKSAREAANEFGRVFYNINNEILAKKKYLDSISNMSTQEVVILDGEIHAAIKAQMTVKGFENVHNNRSYEKNITYAVKRDCTMELKEITLTERVNDGKKNEIGYDYEAKVRIIQNKDKKESEEVETGYIGLTNEKGNWKVNIYELHTGMNLNVQH